VGPKKDAFSGDMKSKLIFHKRDYEEEERGIQEGVPNMVPEEIVRNSPIT